MDGSELGNLGRLTESPVSVAKTTKGTATPEASVSSTAPDVEIALQYNDANQLQSSDIRRRANEIINVINVTASATDEISKLVESISGIVEQAQQPEISDSRRQTLQKEANQLVAEIRNKAQSTETGGVRPLLGENVRFDIEQKYGYALDIILPDGAKDAFGLGQINLSLKENILDTLTRVEQAKKQFEELRQSVTQADSSVRQGIDTIEVALQNSEASKTSIRSLDQALSLATDTYRGIGKDRDAAFGSFSKLDLNSLSLLQS